MHKSNSEGTGVGRILLRVPEAAESLGIGKSLLYTLINDGEIPVVRIRGAVRISPDDLQAWVRRQAVSPQQAAA